MVGTGEPRWPPPPPGTCVLVVDDEDDIRSLVAAALSAQGYDVETAVDGVEALERIRCRGLPDVIVTDLMMPRMDGWRLVAELHAHGALAKIPVVVMSAAGSAMLATAPSAEAYVSKPFDLDRLVDLVRRSCVVASSRRA